jgi:Tfp pilus assembly protein PilX
VSRRFPSLRSSSRPPAGRPPRRGEAGSAYIMVLLALLVISVLGFSLVFITQTEMEIGANERTIQRTFYGSESGLAIASARVLVTSDHRPTVVEFKEPGAKINVIQRLEIAPAVPIYDAPCNLCEINNTGTYQEKAYRKINNALTVKASRVVGSRNLGTKTVASMLELQPWKSPVEAYLAIGNDAQLSQVRW